MLADHETIMKGDSHVHKVGMRPETFVSHS